MRARSAITACRPRRTASSSPRAKNTARAHLRRVCATPTCNSTASGTTRTAIVSNLNNDQVGAIVKFAMENPGKVAFVAFQPVSFTGRDEDITPERRMKQRYTLSHLAKDVSSQIGRI